MLGAAVEQATVLAAAKARQERLDNDKKSLLEGPALSTSALLCAAAP